MSETITESIAESGGQAVYTNPVEEALNNLKQRFPDDVSADERDGYEGVVVSTDRLLEVGLALRDELGFNFLSSVTGVDLIDENKLEVVYHAYSINNGGSPVVFKVQADRGNPLVPSLVPVWPAADFQEREAYDMFGIVFEGHPDLRRILTWEGFEGHPLRKDWTEPFFEEENKPFGSRWPAGEVHRAEENNVYGKNVQYPPGWVPTGEEYDVETEMYTGLTYSRDATPGLKTDKVTINLGPQHPSTHGVFRMVVTLDGETIIGLKPVMGYLHRNHEKIGERNTFIMNMPYTDRLDYLSSMSNNFGYALTIEKLLDIQVAERAEWIRILMVELTRIANHLWAVGFLLNDLGAFQTPMLYYYIEREFILDFFEAAAGSRMMCNYMRFGGVAYDLPDEVRGQPTYDFLDRLVYERLPAALDDGDRLMTGNEIVRARSIGVGLSDAGRRDCLRCVWPDAARPAVWPTIFAAPSPTLFTNIWILMWRCAITATSLIAIWCVSMRCGRACASCDRSFPICARLQGPRLFRTSHNMRCALRRVVRLTAVLKARKVSLAIYVTAQPPRLQPRSAITFAPLRSLT